MSGVSGRRGARVSAIFFYLAVNFAVYLAIFQLTPP